jgi:hypothetical protein
MRRWLARLTRASRNWPAMRADPVASAILVLYWLAFGAVVGWVAVTLWPTGTVGDLAFWGMLFLGLAWTIYRSKRTSTTP